IIRIDCHGRTDGSDASPWKEGESMEPDVKTRQTLSHVAIVTGGGRGLGRAMVLGLAEAGIHVVATAARERAEIEAVAEEVRQSCGESHDPADRVGAGEIDAARSFDHGPTVALARVAGSRWDDGPSFGGDQMADG